MKVARIRHVGTIGRASLIVLALLGALLPVPRAVVERFYSVPVYPYIQRVLTSGSNLVSFAWLDALLVVVLAWLAIGLARDLRQRRRHGWRGLLLRGLRRPLGAAVALYLAFLAVWGLNYRRQPLVEKLQFDAARVSPARALALAEETVEQLNALYTPAHRTPRRPPDAIDPELAHAFEATQRAIAPGIITAVPARPKYSVLDPYFRRAGVAGMTNPYLLETLVASDLLPFERPFVVAHEWSHLAGITDEGEANFAGWLACARAGTPHRYSAWLFLYGELSGHPLTPDGQEVLGRLAPGPRGDLAAIRERLQRQVSPLVAGAGWRIYDRYLKANRVEHGTASYAQVVRLLLGVGFEPNWTPVRKPLG
jgi:hypothetical protein